MAARPPPLFFDEDDDFGEFEFVSAPPPAPPPQLLSHPDYFRAAAPLHPLASIPNMNGGSGDQSAGGGDDGDDWGDFMESPLRLDTPSLVSPSPSYPQLFPEPASARSEVEAHKTSKGWEKPTGAIPLSIFGEEEGEVDEPDLGGGSALPGAKDLLFHPAPKPAKGASVVGSGTVAIRDLLADLYGQAQATRQNSNGDSEKASDGVAEGGADDVVGHSDQDDDFDDGGWEFKAAMTDNGIANPIFGQEKDTGDLFSTPVLSENGALFQKDIISGSLGEHVAQSNSSDNSMDPIFINGLISFDEKKLQMNDSIVGSKDYEKNIDLLDSQGPKSNGKYQGFDEFRCNDMEDLSTYIANNKKQESPQDMQPVSRSISSNGGLSNEVTNFHLLFNLYEETGKSKIENTATEHINDSANAVLDSINTDTQLFNDNGWHSDAFMEKELQEKASLDTQIHQYTKSEKQKKIVSFYSDLKQAIYSVALRHLENHKKAYKLADQSGEELKAAELYKEIQEASVKLQIKLEDIENAAKDINMEGTALGKLLEILRHPQLGALDREFSLSEWILSAEKEIGTACDLYEHASSTLYLLQSASLDVQQRYIMVWSEMLLACLQELQHGANIWTDCIRADICTQILSKDRGCEFLLALGEIYRVSSVLHVSLHVFKPWMLLSTTEEGELFACSKRCSEFWMDSGLYEAFENVSEQITKEKIRMLLESIKTTREVNVQSLQNRVSTHTGIVCQLSLLPLGMFPDMKDVVWDGKSYFLRLANLWANRISCDPPNLPPWKIG